ncbi:biopolymer transporter ExbD [Desulfuromonas acetoxidans]|uniref:Biopolymer transport protein ExbD/TolR n=1 Tax=Desulfuromonas acetoxidans (strain DSM 684 / 11070) TaxID=281689 RepID=Q1K0D0_DESA6|nr:biopolymer transporter ExbD [Desulfuromonas acetoxidans]EAT16011.1 Biopolymer transport protein ExbD/TolR [Desulfuromonas acetoxidans DSM 684]MBF0644091.1 biopolymer transporter ExbD [Desulfuromonas acetoxidans]NVD24610.1 biopolymer transporter ExbD [Desulfuromonas acetoxidans]NVE16440.1 biopolymer transporter ExbD [Desulfuromonas acetoxidans]
MNEKEFDAINVIPFIDILLVLLTIVLTTSTFITTGALQVKLPQATATQPSVEKTLSIVIKKDGQLSIDKQPVVLSQIAEHLNGINRDTAVLLHADRDINLQRFVEVMAAIKEQGFHQLSVLTENH